MISFVFVRKVRDPIEEAREQYRNRIAGKSSFEPEIEKSASSSSSSRRNRDFRDSIDSRRDKVMSRLRVGALF